MSRSLDGPLDGGAFGETALLAAVKRRDRDGIDALLRAGANINQKSHWWAGGFHVLDGAWETPWLAPFLIARGAVPEIHHAVQLEMFDEVRRMLEQRPDAVHARGGDGQTPLHATRSREMAELLLGRGADVDARDVDHESTPAQYMIRDRQDIARFLVEHGALPDILMTAALGDIDRTRALIDANPEVVRTTVSDRYFPKRDPRAGGTIYNWTLGTDKSPHEAARDFGHEALVQLLISRTPDDLRLSVACALEDEALVDQIRGANPRAAESIGPDEAAKLAAAARNNKTATMALMLKAGWPVDVRGPENATPLHWAAFHGNTAMVRALLARGADPKVKGDVHDRTPLDLAQYGREHGWQCRTGDYPGVIELLQAKPASNASE
jgi:ankyrin repeat protein